MNTTGLLFSASLSALLIACGASDGSDDGAMSGSGGSTSSATGGTTASDSGGSTSSGGSTDSGGSAGSGGSSYPTAWLEEEPHCADREFHVVGTIDGVAIDYGVAPGMFNGGYFNGVTSDFKAEGTNPKTLAMTLNWSEDLGYGEAAPVTTGTLKPPEGAARAGIQLCVTEASVGYVPHGTLEAGEFKMSITGARVGADCSGEEVPIDLHGCYN